MTDPKFRAGCRFSWSRVWKGIEAYCLMKCQPGHPISISRATCNGACFILSRLEYRAQQTPLPTELIGFMNDRLPHLCSAGWAW
jgi:hypothetical protein